MIYVYLAAVLVTSYFLGVASYHIAHRRHSLKTTLEDFQDDLNSLLQDIKDSNERPPKH